MWQLCPTACAEQLSYVADNCGCGYCYPLALLLTDLTVHLQLESAQAVRKSTELEKKAKCGSTETETAALVAERPWQSNKHSVESKRLIGCS